MLSNKLKSNDGKTVVFCSTSLHTLALTSETCLTAGQNKIQFTIPSKITVYIRRWITSPVFATLLTLSWEKIASVRSFLTRTATVQCVSSLILSHLDDCNSVFAGFPSKRASFFAFRKSRRTLQDLLSGNRKIPCHSCLV